MLMENKPYVSPDDVRGTSSEDQFIKDFLKNKEALQDVPKFSLPFVTISREAASGGHLLANVLLSDMNKQNDPSGLFSGWHILDRELAEIIAQNAELQNSVEQLLHKKYHSEFKDFIDSLFTGQSDKYLLHRKTSRIMHMLAAVGKVIIVGSTACCITRDLKAGIHIRLVAPENKRVAWMMKRFGMNKQDAKNAVDEQDLSQEKLLNQLTGKNSDCPLLYHATYNTAMVEMQEISRSIISMIRSRVAALAKEKN